MNTKSPRQLLAMAAVTAVLAAGTGCGCTEAGAGAAALEHPIDPCDLTGTFVDLIDARGASIGPGVSFTLLGGASKTYTVEIACAGGDDPLPEAFEISVDPDFDSGFMFFARARQHEIGFLVDWLTVEIASDPEDCTISDDYGIACSIAQTSSVTLRGDPGNLPAGTYSTKLAIVGGVLTADFEFIVT